MKLRFLPFLALLGLPLHDLTAQTTSRPLNLDEVISLAVNHSAIGKQANTDREIGYWQWRDYRSTYRPQIGVQGNLPNYSRTITPVVQPEDGSIVFRQIRNNNSNVGFAIKQNIGLTGGQVVLGADVLRYDDFVGKAKRYNSQPFNLGLTQPIGQFNELHWNRRIEPLRYQESQRQYLEEREKIAQRTTELYFDVLLQQVNAEVARQNAQATDELLRIGQERYRLGRLSQSDLLQLELNLLDAQQAKIQAQLSAQNATVELQAYTGLATAPALDVPKQAPQPVVAPEVALEQARQHRSAILAFQRRLLEAERDVAEARGTTGMQATLSANLGYVNQAPELNNSLQDLRNQQQVKLSFSMPLLDWGHRQAVVKTAKLTREQVQYTVAQEERSFAQSVLTEAGQQQQLTAQLRLAQHADSVAQRRYDIARSTYLLGRISLTDLSLATQAKDGARRSYIAALRARWVAYYRLRALTLYDFEKQQPLAAQ